MAGLYVHVPFRRARRSYDDAYYCTLDSFDVSRYATALCQELTLYAHQLGTEEPITTFYAGGGRPSLLPLETIHRLLASLLEAFDVSAIQEATAEINPSDAHLHYLRGLQRMGFDRLSIEVLSFLREDLAAIDAPHSDAEAVRTIEYARKAGLQNLSVDLLFGWPGHSLQNWKATLRQAVRLSIPHITLIEAPHDEKDRKAEMKQAKCLEFAMDALKAEGYEQYEITHFAQPKRRSLHQKNYYAHGNHLGLGPSAQTFWWPNRSQNTLARRWSNVSDVERYVELLEQRYPPVAYRQTLDRSVLAREFVLLRLRTKDGLDLKVLEAEYGVDLRSTQRDLLDRLAAEDLIHNDNPDHVRLTDRGRLVADAITERLMPG